MREIRDLQILILLCSTVPEGENNLNIELVNESSNNGGIVATAKVALNQVYNLGNESKWVQLNSNNGRSYGELKLNLTFNVSLSFYTMLLLEIVN